MFIINDTDATNQSLQLAARVPYEQGSYDVYFRDAIQVTNQTDGRTTVGIAFDDGDDSGYGEDVGGSNILT